MYWLAFKLFIFSFVPLPVGSRLVRPDPQKNEWVFSCREWKSLYRQLRESTTGRIDNKVH